MELAGTNFGGFDLFVFFILGFSGILSFARGLSRELISIVSLVAGIAGALFLFGRYQFDAQGFIKPAWLANTILILSAFLILYFLVGFVLRGWTKAIQGNKSGLLDRLLGLAFGLTRGLLVASLFVLVISKSAKDGEPAEWMTSAKTYPILRNIADRLQALPIARARDLADDIQQKGEDDNLLPDLPQPDGMF